MGKKRLAADILKTSKKNVRFVVDALDDIKKAITRSDIKGLIAIKKIIHVKSQGQSSSRSKKIAQQKKKGRQKGRGSKKGKKHSVLGRKEAWVLKIRTQRKFIKNLRERELVDAHNYRILYNKCKGGYFRNKRHIKLFLTEQKMINIKTEK